MTVSRSGRIAFFLPSFERGGVERLVINLSKELVERGWTVDVLVREADPTIEELHPDTNVISLTSLSSLDSLTHTLFPPHVANSLLSLPSYVRYLREERPELLVSMQTSPFAVLGARLSRTDTTVAVRESNTPSVATETSSHTVGRFAPLAKRLTYPRADHLIAVSEDAAADIAELVGIPEEEIEVIYNPTFNDRILRQASEPVDHLWFSESVPVIVSVGRFSDQKDFETLIRAVSLVRQDRPVRLVIVGDGENRERLEKVVEDLELEDVVEFLGYRQNPYKFMAKADLFVLSSNYEGLPNVLIEAIGVGTPAISTDCPSGPREILLEGDGGTLLPVGDVQSMASAILDSLSNPDAMERQLDRARDHLDRFTPRRAAQAYINLATGDADGD